MIIHFLYRLWRRLKYVYFLFLLPIIAFGQATTYQGINFPQGALSFADRVVDYRISSENRANHCANPNFVLGVPDREKSSQNTFLAIGNSQSPCQVYVTVQFLDNYLIDIEGNDLWIFEVGNTTGGRDEPLEVYISNDLQSWIFVGRTGGGKGGIDIADKVLPNQRFQYVRICDEPGSKTTTGSTPGPDIDAIGAIGSIFRPEGDREDPIPPTGPISGTNINDNCGPPSLAGHHSWIDLSREACISRAQNAIRSAGFNILGVDNGYVIGKTDQHTTFIRCICTINGVQPDEETLMAVTVATPDNWPEGAEPIRDYLVTFMQNPASAGLPPDLTSITTNTGGFIPNYNPSIPIPTNSTVDCSNPRLLPLMDDWLQNARPYQQAGESLRYESWGRVVGTSSSSVISVNGPPTTNLTRCEWLWQYADQLESQDLGTLKNYVLRRL